MVPVRSLTLRRVFLFSSTVPLLISKGLKQAEFFLFVPTAIVTLNKIEKYL